MQFQIFIGLVGNALIGGHSEQRQCDLILQNMGLFHVCYNKDSNRVHLGLKCNFLCMAEACVLFFGLQIL